MIKLREKGERADNGGPAVNVHCSMYNIYGRESVLLELQQESEYKTEPDVFFWMLRFTFDFLHFYLHWGVKTYNLGFLSSSQHVCLGTTFLFGDD